jgi:hypothetical protein
MPEIPDEYGKLWIDRNWKSVFMFLIGMLIGVII